jgi:hypothetical protein
MQLEVDVRAVPKVPTAAVPGRRLLDTALAVIVQPGGTLLRR